MIESEISLYHYLVFDHGCAVGRPYSCVTLSMLHIPEAPSKISDKVIHASFVEPIH